MHFALEAEHTEFAWHFGKFEGQKSFELLQDPFAVDVETSDGAAVFWQTEGKVRHCRI